MSFCSERKHHATSYSSVELTLNTETVGFGRSVGRVLEASRVSVAWIPVGICQGALEKTVSYVTNRKAFGAMLSSNQLVQGAYMQVRRCARKNDDNTC